MASKRDRQRRLERARAERRIARQAHQARRRRQTQAAIGAAVVLVLIVLGTTWALGGFDKKPPAPEANSCVWTPLDPATNPNVVDVGTPPTTGHPTSGTEPMTIRTNLGEIDITLNLDQSPCAAASFAYLGSKNFFANSTCSMMSKQLKVLQCGDPKSTGAGGPGYQFANEFVPTEPVSATIAPSSANPSPSAQLTSSGPFYATGQVVLVNTGANTNGSQFYIIYGDGSSLGAAYSVIGTVSAGMDIVNTVVQGGAVDSNGKPADQGKPKTSLTIQQLFVGTPPSSTSEPGNPPTSPAAAASPSS